MPALVASLLPGFRPFSDHTAYVNGVFRCQIGDDERSEYSANRKALLRFHSDMALLSSPPSMTVIRCVSPDVGVGEADGANVLLHIEDILDRLEQLGRRDLVEFVHATRSLRMADGSIVSAALGPPQLGSGPLRVFDRIGWQLAPHDAALLTNLLELCHSFDDLWVRVRLEAGAVLAFSNRHFLHSRVQCSSEARVTELCLGDLSTG